MKILPLALLAIAVGIIVPCLGFLLFAGNNFVRLQVTLVLLGVYAITIAYRINKKNSESN